MGLFRKKPDPISERARDLNKQISELEKQIRKLSSQEKKLPSLEESAKDGSNPGIIPPTAATPAAHPPPPAKPAPLESPKIKQRPSGPRIRSTSLPLGPTVRLKSSEDPSPTLLSSAPVPALRSSQDPIFEELGQNPFRSNSGTAKAPESEMGIRQDTLSSNWQRLKNHFRGPSTSNPKLVNYLAAGSIQGLRPLRYERRVARNRTIVLIAVLLLFLLGTLALLLRS